MDCNMELRGSLMLKLERRLEEAQTVAGRVVLGLAKAFQETVLEIRERPGAFTLMDANTREK